MQVQQYYNSLLRQINDMLDLASFDVNIHDAVDQMITVLSYRVLSCERVDGLHNREFVTELRDMIITYVRNLFISETKAKKQGYRV